MDGPRFSSYTSGVVKGCLIAIVDDDFRVLKSLESLLESMGYMAAVFASSEAFLQSKALTAASCLITDIRMPNIDGLELQRRLKRQRPELPIIFMTAHYDEEVERSVVQRGAAGFLRKSFSASELSQAIRRALGEAESQ
jgi:FixJ family two-component response regulator